MTPRWALMGLAAGMVAVAAMVSRDAQERTTPKAAKPIKQAKAAQPKLPPDQRFRSRPDLTPPAMTAKGFATGHVFLAPKRSSGQGGPTILDERGQLVWFHPTPKGKTADDLRAQTYDGDRVLTWWVGKTSKGGYGQGEWVIADRSYREIARVRAGNGLHGDLHDMQLTKRGTALITIYEKVKADLTPVNSFADGQALDSVIQEVDVRSGKVVWEWHSLDHVGVEESYVGAPKRPGDVMDYFHINSIDEYTGGHHLLLSARNTWALYKIDKQTGAVDWRLGGRRSDFALGQGVRFAWQHDARGQPDRTITLFDNQATPKIGEQSRALKLDVDEVERTATVAHEWTHPEKVLAFAEGNAQWLGLGDMMIGWGLGRRLSIVAEDGELVFDVRLPADTDTYRALQFAWQGEPAERPAAVAERAGETVTAYASWNGATHITRWELLAGPRRDRLRRVAVARPSGFETALEADTDAPYVAVRARFGGDKVATSAPIRVG